MDELQFKIIEELIETEKSYLNQIQTLQTFFNKPLLENGLLPTDVHSAIFGQLSAIYQMNSTLLEEISRDKEAIGTAFRKFGPFLKVYSSYANNFQKSLAILEKWETENESLRTFLRSTETRPEVQTKIISLLITPIQRLPRYKLLLEQLLKCHVPSSSSYDDIEGALEKVKDAAKHVNQSVDDSHKGDRLLLLQKALKNQQPNIIVPGRKLLKEGSLNKVSRKGKGSQARFFFLFSDMLMYTKIPSQGLSSPKPKNGLLLKANSLECCCILPLRHCRVTTLFGSDDQGITFRLQCADEDLLLYSDCSAEGKGWIEAIKATTQEALTKRKTLRKKSSRRRAIRKPPLRNISLVEQDASPPSKRKKETFNSPNLLAGFLHKTEALKYHLRSAKECLTPPSRKLQTPKKLDENTPVNPQNPFTPLKVSSKSITTTSKNASHSICHSSPVSHANSSVPFFNPTSSGPVASPIPEQPPTPLYNNSGSIRNRRPKPLSPLATCSWTHSNSTYRISPTLFSYRSGVRGSMEGSSVRPQQTFTPPVKKNGTKRKRPISDIFSPSWSKRKMTKDET